MVKLYLHTMYACEKSKFLFKYFQSNPAYPPVEKVRDEIIQMLKGMACSAIFPALSLYCAIKDNGLSKAFCGWGGWGLQYHLFSMFVIWLGSDFYEFAYHRLGHVDFRFWKQVGNGIEIYVEKVSLK